MAADPHQDTVLIVDDSRPVLIALSDYLRDSDFTVLTADDGDEAISQATKVEPDIIILDIMMPGIDGFETCRRLKDNNKTRNIPVIFMTALSEIAQKIKGFELGAVDFVTKPIQPEELLARINAHLTIHKLQTSLQEHNKTLEEENFRRRRVQEVLRESRERYRLLAENSTDMISRQTPDGIFRYASPACRTLLGYEIEELIGTSAMEYVHPDDLSTVRKIYDSKPERPPISTITYRAGRRDDKYIWLETTARVIRDPETNVELEIIAVSRNVTERKKAEEALQQARDELELRVAERTAELATANKILKDEIGERKRAESEIQAYSEELQQKNEALSRLDQLKDEFLANTSHELRTPLNGIIGIAQSLIDGAAGALSPEQAYNLSMIVSSGSRLATLVNDILDFSKLKHQELDIQLKAVDMHTITEVVLTLSQPLVDQKPLQLTNKVGSDLPPVKADEDRVQQIMHNLVGNALKFTKEGTVTVSAVEQAGALAITVADTGMGIPPDKFDTIFQSFEQIDASTTRSHGGTGLGLSITKQLVELHGGTIKVDSQAGQGSQFTFTPSAGFNQKWRPS
jgi:PAS domain S-box-containing protein